jgi:hypothetical protein
LRIHLVPAAAAGQAGQDRCGPSAARVSDEQRVEMRRAQLLLSAERRHTLPAPHLFGNQPAPLRPCISVSFSLRHRATLLCDDHLPQDAVHVPLTMKSDVRLHDYNLPYAGSIPCPEPSFFMAKN